MNAGGFLTASAVATAELMKRGLCGCSTDMRWLGWLLNSNRTSRELVAPLSVHLSKEV